MDTWLVVIKHWCGNTILSLFQAEGSAQAVIEAQGRYGQYSQIDRVVNLRLNPTDYMIMNNALVPMTNFQKD